MQTNWSPEREIKWVTKPQSWKISAHTEITGIKVPVLLGGDEPKHVPFSRSKMNSKTGTGLESLISINSSVPCQKHCVIFHSVAAPQIHSAADAASWLGFLPPNFSVLEWGLQSESESLAFPPPRQAAGDSEHQKFSKGNFYGSVV